jgi:hypothetical protein
MRTRGALVLGLVLGLVTGCGDRERQHREDQRRLNDERRRDEADYEQVLALEERHQANLALLTSAREAKDAARERDQLRELDEGERAHKELCAKHVTWVRRPLKHDRR